MITADWCREHDACYSDEELDELFPTPITLQEVLTLDSGEWAKVPFRDRLWIWDRFYVWKHTTLRQFVYDILDLEYGLKFPDLLTLESTPLRLVRSICNRTIEPYKSDSIVRKAFKIWATTAFYSVVMHLTQEQRNRFVSYLLRWSTNESVSQAKSVVAVDAKTHTSSDYCI